MTLQRFDVELDGGGEFTQAVMTPAAKGEYILHSDHVAALAGLHEKILGLTIKTFTFGYGLIGATEFNHGGKYSVLGLKHLYNPVPVGSFTLLETTEEEQEVLIRFDNVAGYEVFAEKVHECGAFLGAPSTLPLVGRILQPHAIPSYDVVGISGEGESSLNLALTDSSKTPVVRHTDGRVWELGWGVITHLAMKAFAESEQLP